MFIFDIISKFFMMLWSKGKVISRIDFSGYYRKFGYPTPFIEQHKSAPGVNDVFKRLKSAHNIFKDQRAKITSEESPRENRKYLGWKIFHLIKLISKRLVLIGMLLFIVFIILACINDSVFGSLVGIVIGIALFIVVISLVSKCGEKIAELSYEKYSHKIKDRLIAARNEYLEVEAVCTEEMDVLCLASLSDEERGVERRHREIIRMEEENAKKMASLNDKVEKVRKENKRQYDEIKEKVDKTNNALGIKD